MSAGRRLLEHGNISQQVVDQRRNKLEAAEAGYVAANAQRDQAEAAIKAAEADVERLQVNSRRSWCSCPQELDACNTGLLAPVRWLPQDSAY